MFRRLKRELCFVGENIPVLGLGAFICCIGGVFLWVGGDSSWYYAKALHNENFIPLGVIFTVWLLTYGMTGFVLAMSCLSEKLCSPKCGMKAAVLGGFAYLLMLMFVNFTARNYVCSSKKNIFYHTCVNYSHRSSSDILSLLLNFVLFVKLV